MKILKTSALAAVLALASFSANATTYVGTDTLDMTFNMATAITVDFTNSTLTFDNVVPNDTINATQGVTIVSDQVNGSADGTRTITCTLSATDGSTVTGATLASTGLGVAIEDSTGADAGELTLKIPTCTGAEGLQQMTIEGSIYSEAVLNASSITENSFTTPQITLTVAYVAEEITGYTGS